MTRDELLAAYNNGERDFSGKDFSGIDLGSKKLIGANFSNCNFTGADLFDTNFSDSNCTNANFTNCNLNATNFSRAIVINSNFTNVNQDEYDANFSGAIREAEKGLTIEKNITHTKTMVSLRSAEGDANISSISSTTKKRLFARLSISLEPNEGTTFYSNQHTVYLHEVIDAENKVELFICAPESEIPKLYFSGIQEGIKQFLTKELPFSLCNVRINVKSGAHNNDSNNESFKVAIIAAVKYAMKQASPEFYVPLYNIDIFYKEADYQFQIINAITEGDATLTRMEINNTACSTYYANIQNMEQILHNISADGIGYKIDFSYYEAVSMEYNRIYMEPLKNFLLK